MATLKTTTDRPRQLPRSRFWPRVFGFLSVTSLTLAPVAAVSLWLMMSDPVTAAAVMERGDLLPVITAMVKLVGQALMSVMSAL